MGDTSWFLGQQYEWHNNKQGRVSCHILQQAMVKVMLEKHNLTNCNNALSSYRSGLNINQTKHKGKDPSTKEKLVQEYQSIVGSIK